MPQIKKLQNQVTAKFRAFDKKCTSRRSVNAASFLKSLTNAKCSTCFDKIKNGDEVMVDCGGSCKDCGTVSLAKNWSNYGRGYAGASVLRYDIAVPSH